MKAAWTLAVALVAVFALVAGARAEEEKGKEVTLKGKLVCGKCTLKKCKDCTNVLQVKDGEKTVNYFIKDDGKDADYHKGICPAGKSAEATVKGTVTEKDGKKWITPTSVKLED
jgi:hypothetical protein